VFSNDMGQSLLFAVIFLAAILTLPLLLAWLDQPHDVRRAVSSATEWVLGRLASPYTGRVEIKDESGAPRHRRGEKP